MAALGTNVLTLVDWAKRVDPKGSTPTIAELLSNTNEILQDMLFMEGNLPTGHRTTVRTGLPTAAWRLLNQGVQPSKSTTAQIDEQCGMLEAWSEVDRDLALLNGNVAQFRFSEATAFIEAMNQEMAQTLFYGNSGTAPEEFTGLAIRYSSTTAISGQNVIRATASPSGSDQSSMYLVVWGANTCHGIFPKNSKAGLIHEDFGEETVETTAGIAGNRMRAFRDHWQWKVGIALRDWRYVVRICNIDISALVAQSGQAALREAMIKAIWRIPALGMGKAAFYANRSVQQYLDIERFKGVGTGGGLSYDVVDGKWTSAFRGIPIRTCDALLETEAIVS